MLEVLMSRIVLLGNLNHGPKLELRKNCQWRASYHWYKSFANTTYVRVHNDHHRTLRKSRRTYYPNIHHAPTKIDAFNKFHEKELFGENIDIWVFIFRKGYTSSYTYRNTIFRWMENMRFELNKSFRIGQKSTNCRSCCCDRKCISSLTYSSATAWCRTTTSALTSWR